jgi:hypothetical protein
MQGENLVHSIITPKKDVQDYFLDSQKIFENSVETVVDTIINHKVQFYYNEDT